MIKDKTGRVLEVRQLVDLPVKDIVTGLVVDIKHAPMEIPGQGLMPACVTIQVMVTIPVDPRVNMVDCYIIRDAPKEKAEKPSDPEGEGEEKVEGVGNKIVRIC